MRCTYCGRLLQLEAKFCPKCGVPTNVRAADPVPAGIDRDAVRHARYHMLLKFASAIANRELVMEDLDQFESKGARVLNLFLPDRTPAFSITSTNRRPLLEDGNWTPLRVGTSHPDLQDTARRIAEEYHRQTRMPASVLTPP